MNKNFYVAIVGSNFGLNGYLPVINNLKNCKIKYICSPNIQSKSKKINAEIHNNAIELMKRDFLPADWSKIGCQDPQRWVELANQMKEVKVLPADFNPHDSYDTSFKKGCFK